MKSPEINSLPRISTVGIIGAGLMGVSIAAANARCGIPVRIYDADAEMLKTVPDRILRELDNIPNEIKRHNFASLVTVCGMAEMKSCDLIIESIIERLDEKQKLYAELEKWVPPVAFLVSNTSTIPIERLSGNLKYPHRFLGLHFLHPVRHRELVEVIPSTRTSEDVLQRLCDYALYIEKTPLCVADCPGFVVNRLLQPYLAESLNMLLQGVSMRKIETAAQRFGMAWGPLRIMDEVGIDTVYHSGRVMLEAYPGRVPASPIIVSMVKQKLLGKKTGRGFYRWDDENTASGEESFNPDMEEIFRLWRKPAETTAFLNLSEPELANRLLMAMAMEGAKIIQDGVVSEPEEVDMAAVIGLGFPEKLGGPLKWLGKVAGNAAGQ